MLKNAPVAYFNAMSHDFPGVAEYKRGRKVSQDYQLSDRN
jgi:hypothetical protein